MALSLVWWWLTAVTLLRTQTSAARGRTTNEQATDIPTTIQQPTSVQKLALAQLAFSLDLYRTVANDTWPTNGTTTDDANLLLSPYSVASVLGMLYLGSNGATASQLKRALHLDNLTYVETHRAYRKLNEGASRHSGKTAAPSANLTVANKVFVRSKISISPVYSAKLLEYYDAELEAVDFAADPGFARRLIDTWVRVHTRGRIDAVLGSDPDRSTSMLLANAVHYHGKWLDRFDPTQTFARGVFHVSPNVSVHVPMMVGRFRVRHGRLETLASSVLELPYADRRLSMLLMLPDEQDGLRRLEAGLKPRDLVGLVATSGDGALKSDLVNVRLPRFELESRLALRDALAAKMGLTHLFAKELADLSGMTLNKVELYVDQLTHRTSISVNEEGTVAAAASALDIERSGVIGEAYFEANRPFMFCLWDYRIKQCMFIGRLVMPKTTTSQR